MQIQHNNRLSQRLLAYVVACSSFLAVLATMTQLFFIYKEDIKVLESNMKYIENSYLGFIAKAVYRIDNELLFTLLDGVLSLQDIGYVEVSEHVGDGNIIKSRGASAASRDFSQQFVLQHLAPDGTKVTLGSLDVYASYDGVYQRLWDKIIIILFTNVVKTFIAAICIFFIFQSLLSRHLNKIAKTVAQMDFHTNTRSFSISLDRRARERNKFDELDHLVSNINTMWSRLSREIADRRQSELKLQESEFRLKKLIEKSPLPMAITDHNQDIISFNDKFTELFGYTIEDVSTAEQWWKLVYPDEEYRQKVQNSWAVAVEEATRNNTDIEMQTWDLTIKDRTKRTCEFYMVPLGDIGLVIMNDITARHEVERSIKENEEMFRALFEQAGGYSMILQPSENGIPLILDANKAACEAHGYTREEMLGRPVTDLEDEEGKRQSLERTKIIMSGKPFNVETNHVRKDGTIFPVAVYANIVRFDDKPPLIVTTQFDISDKKNAEKQRHILERQLQQAQKMESIGNLAGGIAHDFNNILSPIIGFADILKESLPQGSLEHEDAEKIFEAGTRGADLVNQILAFSRQSEHKMQPLLAQKIIAEVLKLARSTIPSNIKILENIQDDCDVIMADGTQIHQVTMNLITNAYHSMGEKSGTISVTYKETMVTETTDKNSSLLPGRYAMLSVSDEGVGIPRTVIDKIFEPYFTTKEQGKGTGLGLSVAYGIIKAYKGDIEVSSEVGKGTTFNVYFPLMERISADAPENHAAELPTGSERILLVDDEVVIIKLEKQILQGLGYKATGYYSSVEAYKAFKATPNAFDLVLTDMTMPDMTGDELARKMISIRADIPVIICTGFSERMNKEKAESLGVKGLLMKPAAKSDLANMIRTVLDEAKSSE